MISKINEHINQYGKIVYDSKMDQKRTVVIIRDYHGHSRSPDLMRLNPEYKVFFLEHQNQVRLLCSILFQDRDEAQLFLEGRTVDNIFGDEYYEMAYDFEVEAGDSIEVLGRKIHLIRNDFQTALDQQCPFPYGMNIDPFMSEEYDQLLGSVRHAGYLIKQGMSHRIHGTGESRAQRYDLIRMMDPTKEPVFEYAEKLLPIIQRIKHDNLIKGFEKSLHTENLGVVVIGAQHTRSGFPIPQHYFPYLEDQIAQELPDTRILVLETLALDDLMSLNL